SSSARPATQVGSEARDVSRKRRSLAPGLALAALVLVAAVGGGAVLILRAGRPRPPAQSAAARIAPSADAELVRLRQSAAAGDADACIALGNAFAERGRWFSAIWAFQDAMDRRPGDFT